MRSAAHLARTFDLKADPDYTLGLEPLDDARVIDGRKEADALETKTTRWQCPYCENENVQRCDATASTNTQQPPQRRPASGHPCRCTNCGRTFIYVGRLPR
jgi:hypothetical protein